MIQKKLRRRKLRAIYKISGMPSIDSLVEAIKKEMADGVYTEDQMRGLEDEIAKLEDSIIDKNEMLEDLGMLSEESNYKVSKDDYSDDSDDYIEEEKDNLREEVLGYKEDGYIDDETLEYLLGEIDLVFEKDDLSVIVESIPQFLDISESDESEEKRSEADNEKLLSSRKKCFESNFTDYRSCNILAENDPGSLMQDPVDSSVMKQIMSSTLGRFKSSSYFAEETIWFEAIKDLSTGEVKYRVTPYVTDIREIPCSDPRLISSSIDNSRGSTVYYYDCNGYKYFLYEKHNE